MLLVGRMMRRLNVTMIPLMPRAAAGYTSILNMLHRKHKHEMRRASRPSGVHAEHSFASVTGETQSAQLPECPNGAKP